MKFTLTKKNKKTDRQITGDGEFTHMFFFGIIMIVFIIFGILTTGWFVYTNIYQTIDKAQAISTFESGFSFRPINFKLFNETMSAWEEKYNQPTIPKIRDPFNPILEKITEETTEELNEG